MEGAGNPLAVHVKTAESVALVTYSVSLEKTVGKTIKRSKKKRASLPKFGARGWHVSSVASAPKFYSLPTPKADSNSLFTLARILESNQIELDRINSRVIHTTRINAVLRMK